MTDRVYINGVAPGCGTVCKSCDKEIREFCWINQFCELGLEDIGSLPKKSRRPKTKAS